MATMPTQGNGEEEPYCAIIGPENSQKLILAETEDWTADESVQIVCESGHVDLTEWQ